jgi:glycosyltransferase involved in cell wall biosynthesis
MKKKILVRGPVLSRSGYGEQTRFAIRSLRAHEDKLDIFIIPTSWGKTGWIWEENEERTWMDEKIRDTALYAKQGGQFDVSLQVTIPNEWEKIAPINIGYTAGIETTKVAPQWIEKSYMMDKIIVTSNHAKQVYEDTTYEATDKNTGQVIKDFRCQTPIEVVNYPVRSIGNSDSLDLDIETDFNFLVSSQWGPRKNIDNTIKWFVEEFHDQEVGLVVKLNWHNDSINDRVATQRRLKGLLQQYNQDRKCKIYLLHGSFTDQEMADLYVHPKIKAFVSLTHGEGYGLPLFEAAYHGLPIIAPDWSGHLDFLYMPVKDKKTKKERMKAMFTKVDSILGVIPPDAVWDGVLQADSMWCYSDQGSYKMRLREMRSKYDHKKAQAKKLQEWILDNFESSKMHDKFFDALKEECKFVDEDEVNKIFDNLVASGG